MYYAKYGAHLDNLRVDSKLVGIHSALFVRGLEFGAAVLIIIVILNDNRFESTGLLSF